MAVRVQAAPQDIKKGEMPGRGPTEMPVNRKLGPVFNHHPRQAVNPDESDVGPRNGCDQKAESGNHGSDRLGSLGNDP